ncbi:MAG TPA: hypothetical protein VHR66_14530 [Gemmataceae bacterium]|jgi:hypothetical protein|nr:hypothetical protein [Gemmataceae bacterium]
MPNSNSNAQVRLLVGIAVVGLVLFLAIGVGIFFAVRAVILKPRPFGPAASNATYPYPGPGSKDFAELIAEYGKCMKAKGAGAQRHWDVVRFAKEADGPGALTRRGIGPDNPDELLHLENWILETEADNARNEIWDETKILDTRWLIPDREAEIKVRHIARAKGSVNNRYERWWVVFDGGWRIYDKEIISTV